MSCTGIVASARGLVVIRTNIDGKPVQPNDVVKFCVIKVDDRVKLKTFFILFLFSLFFVIF